MSQNSIDIESQQRIHFLRNLEINLEDEIDAISYYKLDLSDFGNALGNVLRQECVKGNLGFEFNDFIHGLVHGLNLNTHEPIDNAKFSALKCVEYDFIKNVEEFLIEKIEK